MVVSMCLIKDRNGTWIVRKKVPKKLREVVSRVLSRPKQRQTFLQKSTGTKLKAEAKRLAPTIMVEFTKTLQAAADLLTERPLRTVLVQAEIERLANWHYAHVLDGDDEYTREGGKEAWPEPLAYGLSLAQTERRDEDLAEWLPIMKAALSRGDISMISETMAELLDRAQLNLDPNCADYRKLGLAVLRADVRALEALERRANGEPIDTPPIAQQEPIAVTTTSARATGVAHNAGSVSNAGLRAAFEGWRKERERSAATVAGFERAIILFEELHGEMPVAEITKTHARQFREALQDIPRNRPKELAGLTLPALIEWRRANPAEAGSKAAAVVTPATVNKLLGGIQAVAQWANRNGLISDDVRWSDPFTGMKLPLDEQAGGPFTDEELRRLFSSPVFTAGERPEAGHGDTAFWLPLLALFTGARRSELTRRMAIDITQDKATGQWVIEIYANKAAGQSLKTKGSARTLPIHPELIRLGFLDYVKQQKGRLFPATATDKAANAWTQWFGRYLDRLEISGGRKGLHSLRHGFKDQLRAGGVAEDLNDAITGHSNGSVGRAYGARAQHHSQRHKVILQRYGMQRLVEAVCGVQFPIDLSIIRWRP
jgi:integrase